MIQKFEALENPIPIMPEPTDGVIVEGVAPAAGKPVPRAQRQDLVLPMRPTVVATVPQVKETIYEYSKY